MQNANSYVSDVKEQDFERDVLVKSRTVPVLVDFWAPWCGPCKVLGPTLEKLAQAYKGRFHLAKVNMDESPMLAQVFRIQSIPAVKLFVNGELRDEFMGAYPEEEIVRFLKPHLPSSQGAEAVMGLDLVESGDLVKALPLFEKTLSTEPKNPVALLGMGFYHLEQGQIAEAKGMVERISEVSLDKLPDRQRLEKRLSQLKSWIYLMENASENGTGDPDLSARFTRACAEALEGRHEEALVALLDIVRINRGFREDAGRKGMLAVFDLLPPDSPLLGAYRSKLSNLLFR
ncbi:MAG: co-chaperone YbbN [Deltaproteobacteria bacterium]|nr:co-chaperone YbbN [Deltaproteobacteria bacterium]